jgi:hypothetical protein
LGTGQAFDGLGGKALGAADLLVFDLFAILEGAEPVAFDAAEMHENVGALRIQDESEALLGIEPLDGPSDHNRPPYNLSAQSERYADSDCAENKRNETNTPAKFSRDKIAAEFGLIYNMQKQLSKTTCTIIHPNRSADN